MQNKPTYNPNQFNPNIKGSGSVETINESFGRSVARSHHIKATATTIINTREDLAVVLKKQNIDLLTKATVFQETGDFISSSYVIYRKHNNHQESLSAFLERYPQIKPFAEKINQDLKPQKGNLQVRTSSK